ncbi:MAG TPA: helicase-related protein, partial [Elusimicrobiales bacterium]|nr:helicase-related protein [Elusimicrobiales bacterium]
PMPEICPACSGKVFRESGAGTQRIEAYLKKLLPGARVARCDGDVVRRSVKDARLVYESFRRGEIDVLVGTRLLARGHDFPNLGAVGVVDSDAGLSAADFRASEKIFQTLLEAGAALSGTLAPDPELIVQTRQPGHYVFSVLPGLDYMKFAANELEARKNFFYPPFSELISVTISSVEAAAVSSFSEEMLRSLDCASGEAGAEILGPIVLGEPKRSRTVKESYLVKLPGEKELAECLARLRRLKPPKKVRMKVTADPYSFR